MSKYQHCIQNIEVDYVPVNLGDVISSSDVISNIRPRHTVLMTLMLSNNESGSLQYVAKVTSYLREFQVLFHTDSTQEIGKVTVELRGDLGLSYM